MTYTVERAGEVNRGQRHNLPCIYVTSDKRHRFCQSPWSDQVNMRVVSHLKWSSTINTYDMSCDTTIFSHSFDTLLKIEMGR